MMPPVIGVENVDLGYVFDCKVEELSMIEASHRFIGMNKARKAIPKLDEFLVGLTANEDWALAIEKAFAEHGLEAGTTPFYGNGHAGRVGSHRFMRTHHPRRAQGARRLGRGRGASVAGASSYAQCLQARHGV
jgi:hypothetical protein